MADRCSDVPLEWRVSLTSSCKLVASDALSKIHLSRPLCSLLLAVYQNKLILLKKFVPRCATIGLPAATVAPEHELQSKLQQQLSTTNYIPD